MKLLNHFLILIVLLSLTACSYIGTPSFIKNRDRHYLAAKTIPPLRIPPGLASQQINNQYPIPDRNYSTTSKEVSQVPPGL